MISWVEITGFRYQLGGARSDIPGWIWINQVSITGAMLKLCLLIGRPLAAEAVALWSVTRVQLGELANISEIANNEKRVKEHV